MQATKTLEAINAALAADQGAAFRGRLKDAVAEAGDAYDTGTFPFRSHMGASLIGRECGREIWYGFRWTTLPHFDGRMLRLFNRGHLEEVRFVALLQMIGCTVYQHDQAGNQFRIKGHRGHYGGSLDAVVTGLPDLPNHPVLAEFKTHNDKSFQKLREDGVMATKWEHFVQMQQYMGYYKLTHAIYMAVNKNDDTLYAEIVPYDPEQDKRATQRSIMLVDATEAPPKINQSPAWYKCKFCDHSKVCHGDALPQPTCRSCAYSTIGDDGQWFCCNEVQLEIAAAGGWPDPLTLSKEEQLKGCDQYIMNPGMKAKP